ncbi:MAG: LytTR family DNA-binding domain-containing protein [Bacteroidota bacterium]|nr:LytTR family DNA-binding domain-containing protein [Bacteroidota bacterium]
MIHPFLGNNVKTIQYVLLWIVYALMQAFVLQGLVTLPFWMLLVDGIIHAVVLGVIGILLWSVVKYGNFAALTLYQRLVNNIALALLSIAVWLSVGYVFFYWIFGNESTAQLISVLPVRGLIGFLIYLLIMQRFHFAIIQMDPQSETPDPIGVDEEIPQQKDLQSEVLERIAVKSGSKIHVVLVPEILYLQADGDYVQIFTTQGKYLKEQTMKYFDEHLPENQFIRVHRSVIVNVEMISRIELYEKQNQLLTLKNGQQIKTSPGGYKALRQALNL